MNIVGNFSAISWQP